MDQPMSRRERIARERAAAERAGEPPAEAEVVPQAPAPSEPSAASQLFSAPPAADRPPAGSQPSAGPQPAESHPEPWTPPAPQSSPASRPRSAWAPGDGARTAPASSSESGTAPEAASPLAASSPAAWSPSAWSQSAPGDPAEAAHTGSAPAGGGPAQRPVIRRASSSAQTGQTGMVQPGSVHGAYGSGPVHHPGSPPPGTQAQRPRSQTFPVVGSAPADAWSSPAPVGSGPTRAQSVFAGAAGGLGDGSPPPPATSQSGGSSASASGSSGGGSASSGTGRTGKSERPPLGPVRATVRTFGELCITGGLILILFVVWQLWWTDIAANKDNEILADQLITQWQENPDNELPDDPDTPVVGEPVDMHTAFGIMYVPRFGEDYYRTIAEGVELEPVLNRMGMGHYPSTAMPGEVGNFALAGHRTTYGRPLHEIHNFRPGDEIVVQTAEGFYTYTFRNFEVVLPDAVEVLSPVPAMPEYKGEDRILTLTACNPLFSWAERYIAYAVLSDWQPAAEGPPDSISDFESYQQVGGDT